MTKQKEALEADIRELQMAANIADTFHGRNCIAALDRIEVALTEQSNAPEVVTVDKIMHSIDEPFVSWREYFERLMRRYPNGIKIIRENEIITGAKECKG
jgi:hypothetical protein